MPFELINSNDGSQINLEVDGVSYSYPMKQRSLSFKKSQKGANIASSLTGSLMKCDAVICAAENGGGYDSYVALIVVNNKSIIETETSVTISYAVIPEHHKDAAKEVING